MKKIFLSLLISFFIFNFSFADYTPTEKEKQIITNLEKSLKDIPSEKLNIFKQKFSEFLVQFDKNSQTYFFISEVLRIISEIENEA